MLRIVFSLAAVLSLVVCFASAHDTWVQTNTNIIRPGDAIHVDLMLGNHGNDHRDFKLASKVSRELVKTFQVHAPNGKTYDLKSEMTDLGYAPKEGFYSARFVPDAKGLYVVSQTLDAVLKHGKPVRAYRSAKAYFVVSKSLDKVATNQTGFQKPLGHRIELVTETNPVVPMGPGVPLKVKLLFQGKPLAGVKISFIPRGIELKKGHDPVYERTTDKNGRATFTPKMGTYYLIVAHHAVAEKGKGYERAHYGAIMTVFVPQKCPCCE